MALKLRAGSRIELRWWWEGAGDGKEILLHDEYFARLRLAQLAARPGGELGLRRFLREGTPWLGRGVDDGEVVELLATAVATGKVRVAEIPDEVLSTWGEAGEEEPAPAPMVTAPAPAPPQEEICWPCLRAAASARALREAAAQGVPFVGQD